MLEVGCGSLLTCGPVLCFATLGAKAARVRFAQGAFAKLLLPMGLARNSKGAVLS